MYNLMVLIAGRPSVTSESNLLIRSDVLGTEIINLNPHLIELVFRDQLTERILNGSELMSKYDGQGTSLGVAAT